MALKYALQDNHLTPAPEDCMAVTKDYEVIDIEGLAKRATSRGSTVTKAEFISVWEEIMLSVKESLADGKGVNTPLFRITPSIEGVFNNSEDSFDSKRHRVKLNMRPGSEIRGLEKNIKVERTKIVSPLPMPTSFIDVVSDTTDDIISPGGVGEIKGALIKVNTDSDDEGVWFIHADGTETKVDKIIRNKPSNLIFIIPQSLKEGEYKIRVSARMYKSKNVKSGYIDDTEVK